jgi:hypothetical protein
VGEERAGDDARRDAGGDAQRHDRHAATKDEAADVAARRARRRQKWRASVSFTMTGHCPVAVSRSSNSRPSMTLTPSALSLP